MTPGNRPTARVSPQSLDPTQTAPARPGPWPVGWYNADPLPAKSA